VQVMAGSLVWGSEKIGQRRLIAQKHAELK
jgi:hypothetical protein